MNPYDIIYHFYPVDTPLRRLLILHSEKVRDKAMQILADARAISGAAELDVVDVQLVNDGALLHDIGIGLTHAPGILCEGDQPYICHGTIGAEMLRSLNQDYEPLARICERHTGAGLTMDDIRNQNLPINPVRDLVPESLEEQLVCLADKFYSKSGNPSKEKDFERVKRSMMKFGNDSLKRFEELCNTFYLK